MFGNRGVMVNPYVIFQSASIFKKAVVLAMGTRDIDRILDGGYRWNSWNGSDWRRVVTITHVAFEGAGHKKGLLA